MSDRVSPGQPLKTSPLRKASVVNNVLDSADAYLRSQLGKPAEGSGLAMPTDLVKVKNLTGADRAEGDVVQLGNLLLTSDPSNRHPWFQGNAVAAPADSKFAILRQPLAQNAIGFAQVSGICLARVNVAATTDLFASPVASSSTLSSGASGPVELLNVPSGTGVKSVFVRLLGGTGILVGKVITSSISAGGPGHVEIYADATFATDTGLSLAVQDPRTTGSSLAVGHRVGVFRTGSIFCLFDLDPCAA